MEGKIYWPKFGDKSRPPLKMLAAECGQTADILRR